MLIALLLPAAVVGYAANGARWLERCPGLDSPSARRRRLRDPGGDLGAASEPQLAEDVLDVRRGGALRDRERGGDVLVAQSLPDQFGDLSFPASERRRFVVGVE